ncbi:hypothetical protein H0X90_34590 [Burkholderia sp. 9775_39]|uniref:hypothetical protein n=1 Tax=unclassified Burkholderia TaxID=2613784 RepID=UPI0018C3DAD0|nr:MULTISPECIES: hypothetical protein [unclassified Burkholderia]MBG0881931.1 hypothetical protein [Burkholderia sp. 9775_39]MBG0888858.1 hypothetical protein [Burkholderia sp. 9773_38]
MSSPIPVLLDGGQQAQWMYPKEAWIEQIDKLYSEDWRKTVNSFVVEVSTSVGQTFRAPVDQSLKDALIDAILDFERRKSPSNAPRFPAMNHKKPLSAAAH